MEQSDHFGLLIDSDRDRRTLAWILSQVSADQVQEAVQAVQAQGRKPYVSNTAKALGLVVPANLARTPDPVAKERIAGLMAAIKGVSNER